VSGSELRITGYKHCFCSHVCLRNSLPWEGRCGEYRMGWFSFHYSANLLYNHAMEKEKLTNVDFESIDPYEFKAPYFVCMEHLARYIWAAYILKRKRVKTALDIACGPGYGSRELALEGIRTTGFDIDRQNIRTANEKYSVSGLTDYISGDINAREYLALAGGGPFDAIVCFETLEHVRDPQLFLYDLRRLVRSGGYLVLSVPEGKYEPLDREGAIKSSYHLHAFSEEQVGQMLGAAGFRVQQRMYQPDSAGLHRNEFRAIRDTGATRETAERCYNKSPEAARYLAQVYAWPRKERGESYSNIFVSLNE